jgi:hypothetical protein
LAKCRVEWPRAADNEEVRLFTVFNTSHNSLLVLASDEQEAMQIAQSGNHVHGTRTIQALNYDRMCHLASSWDLRANEWAVPLVEQAIADKKKVTIEFDKDGVWVGNSHMKKPDNQ